MLEPKETTIKTPDGKDKTFILSKFPAIQGREIVCKYPTSGMPKIGDYSTNEETMLKLMKFVSVKTDNGDELALTTNALIDNHVGDWETLSKIEIAMMEYNCSFFRDGKISSFFDTMKASAERILSSTLTSSLGQLLQTEKQPSKN